MSIYTMANAKLYIGTTAAADDLTSYEADSYTEIGEVESVSALVDVQNFAEFLGLGDSRRRSFKTSKQAENITVTLGFDPDDAGQDALRAAADDTSQDTYNFKLEYADDGSTNGTTVFWSGKVGNNPFPGGGAEDISRIEFTIVNDTGFVVEYRA
jgi:hypothetical protein